MYNGSFPCWYCFGEALPPAVISDDVIHNWVMISLAVCFGLIVVSWFTSFAVSVNTKASGLHVILGMVALLSCLGAVTNIQGTLLEVPVTFIFQSASSGLLVICLLLTSNGNGITKSGWALNINQCFAITAGIAFFGFDLTVSSLNNLGYSLQITRMVGYPLFFIGFVLWITINSIRVKSEVKGHQPRQLFFRHFFELLVIYVFCALALFLTDFIACKTYWQSLGTNNSDVITATIGSVLDFFLVAFLVVMLRPSRMLLIGFTTSPPLLQEKDNLI